MRSSFEVGAGVLQKWQAKPCCGSGAGATDNKDTSVCCKTLYPDTDGKKICKANVDITTCEMGDLSGKLGKIQFTSELQEFEESFITNVDTFKDLSIVLHCGKPRVACGNFVEV